MIQTTKMGTLNIKMADEDEAAKMGRQRHKIEDVFHDSTCFVLVSAPKKGDGP
jgi:hypothetical protein